MTDIEPAVGNNLSSEHYDQKSSDAAGSPSRRRAAASHNLGASRVMARVFRLTARSEATRVAIAASSTLVVRVLRLHLRIAVRACDREIALLRRLALFPFL